MKKPIRYESTQEPCDAEEREFMDPDNWDWDHPIEGVTVGEPGTIFTLELSRDEHRLLAQVAYAQGMTPHEFIKKVALTAAHSYDLDIHPISVARRAATG